MDQSDAGAQVPVGPHAVHSTEPHAGYILTMDQSDAGCMSIFSRWTNPNRTQVHKFLWDRMRSIRQDLTLQYIKDKFSVRLHEQMVR
eukprot:521917-Pyramimonas_sp.AAC.1